jgi:hypothetical protein
MILNFSKNSNTEKGRSCCKIFFTKKSYEGKFKSHRNRKSTWHEMYRKVKESFWMKKLNTLEPEGLNTQNERKLKKIPAIERHRYNYNVMFLCICNCCSNVECNSNEEGRNSRNVWNLCYSFNSEIIRDYIYIYNPLSSMQKLVYSSEMVALFYFILDISNRISKIKQPLPKVLFLSYYFLWFDE